MMERTEGTCGILRCVIESKWMRGYEKAPVGGIELYEL